MKTILTLVSVLLFHVSMMAQHTQSDKKVETIEEGVVLIENIKTVELNVNLREIVAIHKFKNTRAKKELVFTTKNNKAKLA
ncbi:MAG: hypothetical protein ED555_08735 [Allomuricauda sp.]|nr:MAG: hypothetical protein ED555_08735 [Allomuricauda sp.]